MGGTFRFIDTRDGGSGVTFDFGEIQSISTTYTASLTTVPIVIYGFRNTMCIDTGVKKDLTFSYLRVNPTNPNDSSTTDSSRWSNAKWLREIQEAMNRWQVYTDGFQVTYTMDSSDKDLFPDIDDNVYVSSITFPISNTSSQYISGQISLKVGTLTTSSSDVPTQYTMRFYRSQGSSEYFDIIVPEGASYPLPSAQSSWATEEAENLRMFSHWVGQSGISGNYEVGDAVTVTGDIEFYGMWVTGRVYFYTEDSTHTISSDCTRIGIGVCGGGGGGAGYPEGFVGEARTVGGGGGAGGGTDFAVYSTTTFPSTLSFVIGTGGEGGTSGAGGDGGDTYVEQLALRGYGGQGGGPQGYAYLYEPGEGANGGYSGGRGASSAYGDAESGEGIYGGDPGDRQDYAYEGGGGGSLGYDKFESALAYLEATEGIVPAGGKGGRASVFAGTDPGGAGTYGCGGGGGAISSSLSFGIYNSNGGDGGDGFVIIVEYT